MAPKTHSRHRDIANRMLVFVAGWFGLAITIISILMISILIKAVSRRLCAAPMGGSPFLRSRTSHNQSDANRMTRIRGTKSVFAVKYIDHYCAFDDMIVRPWPWNASTRFVCAADHNMWFTSDRCFEKCEERELMKSPSAVIVVAWLLFRRTFGGTLASESAFQIQLPAIYRKYLRRIVSILY